MSENEQAPQETVALLFYRKVAALHPQRHAGLKIGNPPDQSFASHTNSVPLAGVEFAESCKDYPIVFVRSGSDDFGPVAVLGLENGENLFLDAEGKWKAGYVPAFVRRYPFVLGDNPDNPSQPWVCVDEACSWLGQDEGEALFVGNKPSAFMSQILAFLTDFNMQSQRTLSFGRKLKEWGLLKENTAQASAEGKNYTLTGLWVIDEAALAKLDADKIQELYRTGELAWIYFHFASLSNFRRLAERKVAKAAAPGQQLH